ncbi:anhydro-N-acetylmuramic acid kinase, partial [bacterium]|nr:anhydro-N-acetylmuramic acid kinase [bacterium]
MLEYLRRREARIIIGLMSGTSADGVDASIVSIKEHSKDSKIDLIYHYHYEYPKEIKELIHRLFDFENANIPLLSHMNFLLGEIFANVAVEAIEKSGLSPNDIDLIASHGQTIFHSPYPQELGGFQIRSTLQIGEGAVIAERTGITTICDFRVRDMTVCGQGAPLVPFADWVLFTSEEFNRGVLNIGGIANITILPKNADIDDVLAFDTGPGNMVIDEIVIKISDGKLNFDTDGNIARKGKVSYRLLEMALSHPYFSLSPPKSTGREVFGKSFAMNLYEKGKYLGLSDEDIVATVTTLTATTIAKSIEPFGIEELIIGGGGAYNSYLIEQIKGLLPSIKIKTHEDFGIPNQAKEA